MKSVGVHNRSQMLQLALLCWLGLLQECSPLAPDGAGHSKLPSPCSSHMRSPQLTDGKLTADENATEKPSNVHGNISDCLRLSPKTNDTKSYNSLEENEIRKNFDQVKAFLISSSPNLDQSVVPYSFGTANVLLAFAAIVPILGLLFILYPCIKSVIIDTPFCKERAKNRRLRSSRLTLASSANNDDSSDDEVFGLSDEERNTRGGNGAQEVMTVSCITTKSGDVEEQATLDNEQVKEKKVAMSTNMGRSESSDGKYTNETSEKGKMAAVNVVKSAPSTIYDLSQGREETEMIVSINSKNNID